MKTKDKTINYNQLVNNNKHINELEKNGVIIIRKKPLKVLGWICVGLGVLPIPFTTPLFIGLGLMFLGLSVDKIRDKVRHKIFMIKYKGFKK